MGCVSTKTDINDIHPNVFEVMNVDEMGHLISPGQLELTDSELILYQKGKSQTRWPLRCLRKYGFDAEIFSFECGRRCPTGAGIYAFRCRKAEQLFNMLQQNIQLRNISEEGGVPPYMNFVSPGSNNANNEFPVPVASTGPPVHRRVPSLSQPEGYLNPTPPPINIRPHPTLSRPGSIASNGPASPITPPALSPPSNTSCDTLSEHNNNKRGSLVPLSEHSYTNSSVLVDTDKVAVNSYVNFTSNMTGITDDNYVNVAERDSHLYMNVNTDDTNIISSSDTNTKDLPNILPNMTDTHDNLVLKPNTTDTEEAKHSYANIDAADLESLRYSFHPNVEVPYIPPSVPQTPTYIAIREVNYAELDLIPSKSEHTSLQVTPDSPNKVNKSYVTIDFKKTNALSQTVNPSIEVEEGSRKTRHNSTISEVTTRHSNSLSD